MLILETFELLPKLPVELRLKVWNITIRNGRWIAHMGTITKPCREDCREDCNCAVELRTEYTASINACHESRDESLRVKAEFKKDCRVYHYSFDYITTTTTTYTTSASHLNKIHYPRVYRVLDSPTPDPAFFYLEEDTVCLDLSLNKSGYPGLLNLNSPIEIVLKWLQSKGCKFLAVDMVNFRLDKVYNYSIQGFSSPIFSTLKELKIVHFVTAYPHLHGFTSPTIIRCYRRTTYCANGATGRTMVPVRETDAEREREREQRKMEIQRKKDDGRGVHAEQQQTEGLEAMWRRRAA